MKDKELDSIFKSSLEGQKANFNPEHWSKMEASLDEGLASQEVEDDLFDKEVSGKLKDAKVAFNPQHWTSLENRIKLSEALKTKIFITKLSEISIILLLIFTFFNLHLDKKNAPASSLQMAVVIDQANEIAEQTNLKKDSNISENSFTAPENIVVANNSMPSIASERNTSVIALATASQEKNVPIIVNRLDNQIIAKSLMSVSESPQKTLMANDKLTVRDQIAKVENLSLLATKDLEAPRSKIGLGLPTYKIIPSKKKETASWYINGFASSDINFINSPFDKIFATPAYTIDALGTTGGISVSYRKGYAELELGVTYSTKSYAPRQTEETVGSFLDGYEINSLDNILFNVVSVPLNVKLHHLRSNKWSMYSSIGLAANLITNAHYLRSERFIPGASGASNRSYESRFDFKSFDDGILDGGSLNDNFFVSANVGMGVQYSPLEKLGLYIQPTYGLHVLSGGVGPNEDKLYNFSVQAGAKYRIN